MKYDEAANLWYGLDAEGKANLLDVIGFTITCGDDEAIITSNIARHILEKRGIDEYQLSLAFDEIANELRHED